MIHRLSREPLVHFLLLGAALFLIGALRGESGAGARRIEVTPQRVQQLQTIFARTWQRPPTRQELDGLIDDYVKEEIYYREARAMGLDEDDTIIRRRLRQKLEFLTDEAGSTVPTEEELAVFLQENAETYRFPPRLVLRQIYFSTDRRRDRAESDARALLERLPEGRWPQDGDRLGDPLLVTLPHTPLSPAEIARLFGERFRTAVLELPVGQWSGPVVSGFGLHLVLVEDRIASRMPTLGEVRREVERDWLAARRKKVADEFYEGLRQRYDIVMAAPEAGPEVEAAGDGR